MSKHTLSDALEYIRSKTDVVPDVAIVLGSGLGELANEIEGQRIPYDEIPGFPVSTAPSHKGIFHVGELFGCSVVAMQGRVHRYEGYTSQEVIIPMQIMGLMGAKTALLTNTAGGINTKYKVGDLVCVEDHLSMANLAGGDPLRGPNNSQLGERFVSMNKAYAPDLITKVQNAGELHNCDIKRGVYGFVTGPTFETPAEIRMLRSFGCDLVGMSTVPEVIAARHMGMRVAVISAVTNMSVSSIDDEHITNEEEVWESVKIIRPKLKNIVSSVLKDFAQEAQMTNPDEHSKVDTLITNGHILTMDAEFTEFREGAVAIKDGKITNIGSAEALNHFAHPEYTIDAKGGLIIPGFINGHCHAAMTLFRGIADDRELADFLSTVWAAEEQHVHHNSVHAGAFIGCAEMAKSGITTFVDMYWHPNATVEAAQTVGLNVVSGPVFVGFKGADKVEDWGQKIEDAKSFLDRHKETPGVHLSLAPHSVYTLEEDQLKQVVALASEYNVPIQVHAAEAESEMAQVKEAFERTPIEVIKYMGLLEGHILIAHGVHLTDSDIDILKSTGAAIVHCPLSNAKTAAGIARVVDLKNAGVPVGLGTDGPSTGNDLDMFKAMRQAAMMQILDQDDPTVLPAKEIVRMATLGGAETLGFEKLTGSLERGKQADISIVSTDSYHMMAYHDPYSAIVYSAGRDDVTDVFSRGRHIVADGRIVAREINKYVPLFKQFSNFVSSFGREHHGI